MWLPFHTIDFGCISLCRPSHTKNRKYTTKLTIGFSRQFPLLNSSIASIHRFYRTYLLYWCSLMHVANVTSVTRTVLTKLFWLEGGEDELYFLYWSKIKCQMKISCSKLSKILLFYLSFEIKYECQLKSVVLPRWVACHLRGFFFLVTSFEFCH